MANNTLRSTVYHLRSKRGFTLIELLVVIAIIGILIGIGVVSYQNSIKLARDSRRKTDLEQIRQALEAYRSQYNSYPADVATVSPAYITNIPTDPKGGSYVYVPGGGVTTTTYGLCAYLEIDPNQSLTSCSGQTCGATGAGCNYEVDNP